MKRLHIISFFKNSGFHIILLLVTTAICIVSCNQNENKNSLPKDNLKLKTKTKKKFLQITPQKKKARYFEYSPAKSLLDTTNDSSLFNSFIHLIDEIKIGSKLKSTAYEDDSLKYLNKKNKNNLTCRKIYRVNFDNSFSNDLNCLQKLFFNSNHLDTKFHYSVSAKDNSSNKEKEINESSHEISLKEEWENIESIDVEGKISLPEFGITILNITCNVHPPTNYYGFLISYNCKGKPLGIYMWNEDDDRGYCGNNKDGNYLISHNHISVQQTVCRQIEKDGNLEYEYSMIKKYKLYVDDTGNFKSELVNLIKNK